MSKRKEKNNSKKTKRFLSWIKRKSVLIITAFMLGISNGMYEEDETLFGNQTYTEQEQKKRIIYFF